MKLSTVFLRLLRRQEIPEREAYVLFGKMFRQEIPESQSKALLLLLARKGESPAEVTGCLKALRSVEPQISHSFRSLMDTCGTGGDGSHSLNISTLAAIVIAGAGEKVAKHGNRGLSSKCGSSDLMEALGVKLEAPAGNMRRAIELHGLGYFHAPLYHPAFARMQNLRKALKTRTIFNLLGPLTNPLKISSQLVGVANRRTLKLYAEVFRRLKLPERVLICRSLDGLDEISTSAVTEIAWVEKGKIKTGKIQPENLGLPRSEKKEFAGGGAADNKSIALRLLRGKLKGPVRDIVLLNAAAGLWISGKAKNLNEGLTLARQSLKSGKAYQALTGLIKVSKRKL